MRNYRHITVAALVVLTGLFVFVQSALPSYTPTRTQALWSQTNTVTLSNTTSELTLLGTGVGSLTLPANFFNRPGKTLRVLITGYQSTTSGGPTLRLRWKLDSTVVLDSTARVVSSSGTNNGYFRNELVLTCRTTGASGSVFGQGIHDASGYATPPSDGTLHCVASQGSAVTIDTTAAHTLNLTGQWSVANTAYSLTTTNVFVTWEEVQ